MWRLLLRVSGAALAVALLVLIAVQWRPAAAAPANTTHPVPYYLALGDSLSRGYQPNSTAPLGVTNEGYVDDLYAYYQTRIPGLQLEKLGCPGESTTTMISGQDACSSAYEHGSQLADAVSFLQQHHVALLTFDIGPNDVTSCLGNGTDPIAVIGACLQNRLETIVAPNLAYILGQLRQAGPDVPMFAMNFYDPFLGLWTVNQPLAQASVTFTVDGINYVEGQLYDAFGFKVANVQQAFQTTNFTFIKHFGEPLNVLRVCKWTWMCTPPYQGDIHANTTGYAVIAETFEDAIRGTPLH